MRKLGFAHQPWARVHLATDEWRRTLCVEGSPTAPSPAEASREIEEDAAAPRRTIRKRPYALIVSGSEAWIHKYLRVPADVLCACSDEVTLERLGIPIVDRTWDGRASVSQLIARPSTAQPKAQPSDESTSGALVGLVAAAASGYIASRASRPKKKTCGNCLKSTDQLWTVAIRGFGFDWEVCNSCVESWRSEERLTSEPKLIAD